jgi:hypothetical protein
MRLRPSVLAALVAALLILPPATGRGEPLAFLQRIDDIPLAPGLTEQPGAGLVFATGEGRIVEAVARGTVSADQVAGFYKATLPQLGWEEKGQLLFRRDAEVLTISLSPGAGGVTVAFSLQPAH